MQFLYLFLYKNYINTTKMLNSFDICIIFSEYLHALHAHCVLHAREGQKL